LEAGRIDPGLAALSAGPPPSLADLRAGWGRLGSQGHQRFQALLSRVLAGQRLAGGGALHLHRLPAGDGRFVLVGGDARGLVWPFACLLDGPQPVSQWADAWACALGLSPEPPVAEPACVEDLALLGVPAVPPPPGEAEAHARAGQALRAALAALEPGRLGLPEADWALALLAVAVLRAWARWLPRFAEAGVPYLLDNLVRRPGTLRLGADSIEVELEPAPLDVVAEMAGYMAEIEKCDWLAGRCVKFRIRR
jgi:hypothetical protein